MFDYSLLEALALVVREGSFERAARTLHVTPSAVSQRVKLLEDRVGQVLVARGQPCTATAAGAPLCRHLEQVALLEHELRDRLPALGRTSGAASTPPTVRIAVGADSVATWFVRALSRFARERPVLLDIVLEDQDHTGQLLRTGAVHGAVTTWAAPVQGCHSVRLGALRYVATCTPAFRARYFARGVTRAALTRAPCLVFNTKDRLQHVFARKVVRQDVELPMHWLPSSHAFVEGCLQELGWAMNPEPMVEAHLARGELVELVAGRPVDVELHWQSWRVASAWFDELSGHIQEEARRGLRR
jgi:LysR family transcriptional regulator, chromosome initiation inhibitor